MKYLETVELKSYKGFGLSKGWYCDEDGNRKGGIFYLVDDGDDYIGEEYPTLDAAKRYIDSL